jgi:hypothetical protein
MKFIRYAIFILITLVWTAKIFGYEVCTTNSGKYIKWLYPNATYLINDSDGPSGSITAILEGMQTWTDIATSEFIFYYGGTTTSTAHGINDGNNIVTFGLLGVGTAAENRSWYKTLPPSREGELLDSDVRFNTYYTWSTTGSPGTYDIQNVGTHEHGHSLCLVDLYSGIDSEKTMYGNVSSGETKKRTLEQDDIDGITHIYTCPNLPSRIEGTPYEYEFFQDAYDNTSSIDTLQSQATAFFENLFIDINKVVYMKAGYDCGYSDNILKSTISGNMTITDGTLIIESGTLEVR